MKKGRRENACIVQIEKITLKWTGTLGAEKIPEA